MVSGFVAAALALAATVPYIRDMLDGQTKPNVVSWFLWALAVGVATAAQIHIEPSWSAVLPGSVFLMDACVLVLALAGYGYAKFAWWDAACLALSLAALALWYASGEPLIALVFGIAADATAFIPTFIKSYHEPFTETPVSWLLFGLSGLAGVGAAGVIDFSSISFALYYFVANSSLWMLIVLRQRVKKTA